MVRKEEEEMGLSWRELRNWFSKRSTEVIGAAVSFEWPSNGELNILSANTPNVYKGELNKDLLEPRFVLGEGLTVRASGHIKLMLGAEVIADLMINLKHGPLIAANYMEANSEGARNCCG